MTGGSAVRTALAYGEKRWEGDGYYLGVMLTNGVTFIGAPHTPADGRIRLDVPPCYQPQPMRGDDPRGELVSVFVALDQVVAAWAQYG